MSFLSHFIKDIKAWNVSWSSQVPSGLLVSHQSPASAREWRNEWKLGFSSMWHDYYMVYCDLYLCFKFIKHPFCDNTERQTLLRGFKNKSWKGKVFACLWHCIYQCEASFGGGGRFSGQMLWANATYCTPLLEIHSENQYIWGSKKSSNDEAYWIPYPGVYRASLTTELFPQVTSKTSCPITVPQNLSLHSAAIEHTFLLHLCKY